MRRADDVRHVEQWVIAADHRLVLIDIDRGKTRTALLERRFERARRPAVRDWY